jgi:hypothetical protein
VRYEGEIGNSEAEEIIKLPEAFFPQPRKPTPLLITRTVRSSMAEPTQEYKIPRKAEELEDDEPMSSSAHSSIANQL